MANLVLKVGGLAYGGWKRIRVTRTIEALAGSFDLEVSDRWGERDPWPIFEEDACEVWIDDVSVISGYVDKRTLSYGAEDHSLGVSGRDKAAALVDCSAVLSAWEFTSLSLVKLATKVAAPFGINVTLDPSVDPKAINLTVGKKGGSVAAAGSAGKIAGTAIPKPISKFSIDPGESAWEILDRACRMAGVLPVSDGFGGILLTRAGSTRAVDSLHEGENILAASAEYDAAGRYRKYIVSGQSPATDEYFGASVAAVHGTATDPSVKRAERVLMVRAEASATPEIAKMRAQWEAKIRAARADSVTVTVQGWTQSDGNLWPLNSLVGVHSPMIGVKGDLLITQAVHSIDDQAGTITQLTLKRPDAFLPEPVVGITAGLWKEIAKGV